MSQYSFGAGSLWGTSTSVTDPTPIRFGALQDVSIDITFTTKPLFSSAQFPVALGRGTAQISGKATFAQFNALILNDLFFNEGAEASDGQDTVSVNENHTVPASVSYIVTVDNDDDFVQDLGVIYTVTGLPLIRVASSPALGEYIVDVDTGVYTFAAADASAKVSISYMYSLETGKTITITNQLLGSAAFFKIDLYETYSGGAITSKPFTLTLNRCMSSKLTLPFKLEDFTLMDFEFAAFADDSNEIGTMTMAE